HSSYSAEPTSKAGSPLLSRSVYPGVFQSKPDHGDTAVNPVAFVLVFVISSQRIMTGPPCSSVCTLTVTGRALFFTSRVSRRPSGLWTSVCDAFTHSHIPARF